MSEKIKKFDVGDFLLDSLAPVIGKVLAEVIKILFNKLIQSQPAHGKVALVSLYPVVDVELEPLAGSTATKLDDALIKGVMAGLEAAAKDNHVPLTNLDND